MVTNDPTGRTFEHALQRLETKMCDNRYMLFTDRSGFRYSLALFRKDTGSTLSRLSVRAEHLPPAIRLPSALHPCRLPLYLLPPGPLSCLPVAPYQLPRRLRRASRRVQISNPPLLALQMYVSDEPKPRYALASITVDGRGQAVTQELAPMGSTEGFALDMWRCLFASRTGRRCGDGKVRWGGAGEHVWDGKQVLWTLMDGVDGEGGASDTAMPTNTVPGEETSSAMADVPLQPGAAPRPAKTPAKATVMRTSTGKIRKHGSAAAPSKANGGSTSSTKSRTGGTGNSARASLLATYLKDTK